MRNCNGKTKYNIKLITEHEEAVSLNSPVWKIAEIGFIECENWDGYKKAPKTEFRILRGRNGFFVHMHTSERNLRAEIKEQNGNVYQDSCMEFFLSADSTGKKYLNFEFNPNGVLHLGFGENRLNRLLVNAPRELFRIESEPKDGDWSLTFYIPDDFLLEFFDRISEKMRGNFYKCGDLTDHQHYASWARIDTESPDFHRPEFFGTLVVSE